MLQTLPPPFSFLGWGWFKQQWLKWPGHPANPRRRLGTAYNTLFTYLEQARLVTAEALKREDVSYLHGMLVVSLQPFEHKHINHQPCPSSRAATLSLPGLVLYGRDSGPTCTQSPFSGDVERCLRCVHAAVMRTYLQHQCCPQRAWRTGVVESDFSFFTWLSCPIQTTTLGHTWRTVQDYR
eukprot:3932748-Amphidinium_carterae.1